MGQTNRRTYGIAFCPLYLPWRGHNSLMLVNWRIKMLLMQPDLISLRSHNKTASTESLLMYIYEEWLRYTWPAAERQAGTDRSRRPSWATPALVLAGHLRAAHRSQVGKRARYAGFVCPRLPGVQVRNCLRGVYDRQRCQRTLRRVGMSAGGRWSYVTVERWI